MAVEHFVKLKTNKSLHHVVKQWLKNMNTDAVIKAGTKPNVLSVNHPYFHLTAFQHQDKHPITRKAVGFDPTISLGFRLLPNGKNHQFALEVVKKTTLMWLKQTDDLLVLDVVNDIRIITRINNQVLANPKWWSDSDLEKLPFDVQMKDIEV